MMACRGAAAGVWMLILLAQIGFHLHPFAEPWTLTSGFPHQLHVTWLRSQRSIEAKFAFDDDLILTFIWL